MNRIRDTGCYSFATGKVSKGCALCVKGRKLVLFITGLCGQHCFYCPVSPDKMRKDVIFANERKVTRLSEIVEEAKLTNAAGAGITGGDPLVRVERCAEYIRKLKKLFGKNFHFHLYTPLQLVDDRRLKMLAAAGLDEIRLHPDLENDEWWDRIKLAKKYDWTVGIEVPVIPSLENETKRLMDFSHKHIDFMTLNELEFSDANDEELLKRGFIAKDSISYGVKGSKEMGKRLLKHAQKLGLRAHFCTAKLKDAVQLTNRIKIRQKNVALPFDIKTEDGTLVRGVAYLKGKEPSFSYRKKIASLKTKDFEGLQKLSLLIMQKFKIKDLSLDTRKARIILPPEFVEENAIALKKMKLVPAIVEEYPTDDALEVDVQFL